MTGRSRRNGAADEPVEPRPPGERVTEIGDYEVIDRERHPWAAGIGLVLLIVVYGLAAVGLGLAVRESDRRVDIPEIEVPSITGLGEDVARERLEELGLIMVVKEASNELVPQGSVYDQEPIPGAKIELGSPVTGLVSTGPAGTVVPDTVGQQGAEAATLLQAVGLSAEAVATYDELVRPGEVLSSSPAAGERMAPGGTVRLAVSNGPAPRTVPAIVDAQGQPRNVLAVLAELGRVGLRPGSLDQQVDKVLPAGTVLAISPPPGTELARGSEVDIVSVGDEEPVVVPWVEGLGESTAVSAMQEAGLAPSVRTVELPEGDPAAGRVVRQGIPGGSEVPSGQPVEVVVGVAPPPPTTTTTTSVPAATTTTTAPR